MSVKSKLSSAARYVGSLGMSKKSGKDFAIGKGQVFTYKRSPAELDKIKKRYEGIEKKRGKTAAKKELRTILESRNARGRSNKSVAGLVDAVVRSESYDYRAKNKAGMVRSFQNKGAARKWSQGSTLSGSEVSKAKTKPDTKDFQKTAGSKATVGIDVVKPKSRAQEATTEKIFTKEEVDAKPVTESTAGAPRAKAEEVKIDGEIKTSGKTSGKTSEVRERSQAPRPTRGMRDKKGKSWKRFVPFTESRRKYKLDKRRKAVAKAEEEEEVASREEELKIAKTRRRARLSEAKARKSQADKFGRDYI